jgi:hypothetical protein
MGNHTSIVVVILSFGLLAAGAAHAGEVTDAAIGYTLRVPDDWMRLPDDVLGEMRAAIGKPGAAGPNFVAAYEPAVHSQPFTYPYILIQEHAYPNTSIKTVSRAEIENIVTEIAGAPPEKLTEALSDDAAQLLTKASIGTPTVVTSPPGFLMATRLTVEGVGPVRGQSVCVLGRTNAVFLHFYAREAEWASHAQRVESLVGNFRRTPDQTVTLGQKTMTTSGETVGDGMDWSLVWTKAIAGAVIGGVIGLGGWLNQRRKKAA